MNKPVFNERSFMVGDLVYYGTAKSNMDGDYDVVYEIKRLTLDDFKFWADNDWDDLVFGEFIKPIPLSDEILEDNFPKPDIFGWWRCDKESDGYRIEYTPDGDFPSGDYNGFVACVKYVHQLQHLISAFNIKTTIKIMEKQKDNETVFYEVGLKQLQIKYEGNGWGISDVKEQSKDKGVYNYKSKENAELHFQRFLKSRPKTETWKEQDACYPLIHKSVYAINDKNQYIAYVKEIKINFKD